MTNSTDISKNQIKRIHLRLLPYLESTSYFDATAHVLLPGNTLYLGRSTDSFKVLDRVCFKSKVVSREHAEIWVENNGECYIRDTKSSTGTFLNDKRLSPTFQPSKAFLLKQGDIVQLGMDYHQSKKEVYHCVKMKICLDSPMDEVKSISTTSMRLENNSQNNLDECCICLNKMVPGESLFVTPCSHIFHFQCCRPLFLKDFPIFVCPLCRSHVDLLTQCRRRTT